MWQSDYWPAPAADCNSYRVTLARTKRVFTSRPILRIPQKLQLIVLSESGAIRAIRSDFRHGSCHYSSVRTVLPQNRATRPEPTSPDAFPQPWASSSTPTERYENSFPREPPGPP